jgi:PAS domain-containing protein
MFKTNEKKPYKVFVTLHDLTEKHKADQKLKDVLDATPFPVAVVDTNDDKIFYWSRSAMELFGHTAPTAEEWYQIAYPDLITEKT